MLSGSRPPTGTLPVYPRRRRREGPAVPQGDRHLGISKPGTARRDNVASWSRRGPPQRAGETFVCRDGLATPPTPSFSLFR